MSADDPFSSDLIEFCRCFSLVIDFLVEFHYYLSAGLFPKSPSFIRNLFIPISSSCHQSHILLYPVAHYNSFSLSFLSHKLYLSWPFSEIKLLSFLCSWPFSSLLFLYTFSPTLNYEHSLYTWHFAWTFPQPWTMTNLTSFKTLFLFMILSMNFLNLWTFSILTFPCRCFIYTIMYIHNSSLIVTF